MLGKTDQWRESLGMVDAFVHADHSLRDLPDPVLTNWFHKLRLLGLKLELEVGAVKPWSKDGIRTFAHETPVWRRVMNLGGPLVSVAMDEPRSAGRKLGMSDEQIIQQVRLFVGLVRRGFPDVLVGDIETYPEFSPTEHRKWRRKLNDALVRDSGRALDFYRIDPNWAAFKLRGGSWSDVAQIERDCRSDATPFSLIYWASQEPVESRTGVATDESWSNGISEQASGYYSAGGMPDQIVVESWIGQPTLALPETNRASFTASVLEAIKMGHIEIINH